MADNVTLPGTGAIVATDELAGGIQIQRIKLDLGGDGLSVPVVGALPVSLDTASLAALETISIANFPATQPVSIAAAVALDSATLAALEAISLNAPVALDTAAMAALTAAATPATQPVSGPLTDAQLRASVVPVNMAVPTNVTTTAYAASLILKNTAGILYGISGYNSKTTEQFIQVHDLATLPADGVAPKVLVKVAASSTFVIDFGTRGRSFANGVVVCNSSTGPTKTIGAADCWFDGQVG